MGANTHATEARRLAVAADGIEAAAEGRLLEEDIDERDNHHRDNGEIRQPQHLAADLAKRHALAGEIGKGLGDVAAENRLAAADEESRAGKNCQRRQSRDERQNADETDEDA